jgi:chemotaxis signal transduction protein
MQVLTVQAQQGYILIPVSMVAQIVSKSEDVSSSHSSGYIRSTIVWREYRIPLINSSEMLGANQGSDEEYDRAVILWPMKGSRSVDLFAFTSLESPRVITIDKNIEKLEIDTTSISKQSIELVLQILDIDGKAGFIPNLKKLSKLAF